MCIDAPQTVGELRVRTGRLHAFQGLGEVEQVLGRLAGHKDGSYVRRLEREPGRKEARYMHLVCGDDSYAPHVPVARGVDLAEFPEQHASASELDVPEANMRTRLAQLEQEVAELRGELAELKEQLGA